MKLQPDRSARQAATEQLGTTDAPPRFITKNAAEKWWIEMARKSVYHFLWYITDLKPALHHEIWLSNYFHPQRRYVNIIGARFSAKSHISVLAMLWEMSRNPFSTNCIISVSSEQAERRLAMMKGFIRENMRYRNVFPWIHIDDHMPNTMTEFTIFSDYKQMPYSIWRSQITLRHSHLDKNPSIKSLGVGGKGLIGSRFSGVVLLDDIVDKEDLTDAAQDKKLAHVKRDIIPCMTRECRLWNIGTRWMIGDLYERLEANPEFHTVTIPAIIRDREGNPHSYWPEEWPMWRIEEERRVMDDDVLFRVMFMCDPTATVAALFTHEELARDLPEKLPDFKQIFITTDFAVSLRSSADWTVLYIVAVDADKNVYVLDGMRFKEEPENAIERILHMADIATILWGRLDGVLIEHVGFQSVYQPLLLKRRPNLPIHPVRLNGDKMHRAKQVSYQAKQRRLFFNQRLHFIDQLKSEFMNFDKHRHDDTLDALGLLFQHTGTNEISARVLRIRSPYII